MLRVKTAVGSATSVSVYTIVNGSNSSQAAKDQTVNVNAIVVNTASFSQLLGCSLYYTLNGTKYTIPLDGNSSNQVPAGSSLLVMGSFTMPSGSVTVSAKSFYWNDYYESLQEDVTDSLPITLTQWSKLNTATATISLSQIGQWNKLASATANVDISQIGQWAKLNSATANIALSETGQWLKLGSAVANVSLSQTGQWNKLDNKATTITVKGVTPPAGTPTITSFSPATGKSGDKIVIKGTNLSGVTTVNFGTALAKSFTIDSPTQITAVLGTGASGYIILIAGTTSAISPTQFTYQAGSSTNWGLIGGIAAGVVGVGVLGYALTKGSSSKQKTLTPAKR